jgi:hypothetical protein
MEGTTNAMDPAPHFDLPIAEQNRRVIASFQVLVAGALGLALFCLLLSNHHICSHLHPAPAILHPVTPRLHPLYLSQGVVVATIVGIMASSQVSCHVVAFVFESCY